MKICAGNSEKLQESGIYFRPSPVATLDRNDISPMLKLPICPVPLDGALSFTQLKEDADNAFMREILGLPALEDSPPSMPATTYSTTIIDETSQSSVVNATPPAMTMSTTDVSTQPELSDDLYDNVVTPPTTPKKRRAYRKSPQFDVILKAAEFEDRLEKVGRALTLKNYAGASKGKMVVFRLLREKEAKKPRSVIKKAHKTHARLNSNIEVE